MFRAYFGLGFIGFRGLRGFGFRDNLEGLGCRALSDCPDTCVGLLISRRSVIQVVNVLLRLLSCPMPKSHEEGHGDIQSPESPSMPCLDTPARNPETLHFLVAEFISPQKCTLFVL